MASFSADDLTRHAASLRALARDLLADDSLAEDAVQQACVAALTRPPAGTVSVGAWLRAVVRSCAHDLWRAEQRRRRREQNAARAETGEPRDAAEQLELQEDIVAAVRSLDEPYRTAIWLRYYEHRTPSEVAKTLGEPVKTVKTRLWRALQLLRQKLDRRYGDRRAWLGALVPFAQVPGALPAIAGGVVAGGLVMQAKGVVGVGVAALLLVGGTVWLWPSAPPAVLPAPPAPAIASTAAPIADESRPEDSATREPAITTQPASRYGSLVVHVRWSDGTPAAGVAILGEAKSEPQTAEAEFHIVADAAGIARAARVHAGTVNLSSDRLGSVVTDVVGGQVREVDFTLPAGVDVVGAVRDGRQQPLAGAQIVLVSERGGWRGGSNVAISDDAGAFAVRSMMPHWSLGARAVGYAPSQLVDLDDVPSPAGGGPVQVELRLLHPGAVVAGTVVDENGGAIPGAIVALGRGRRGTDFGNVDRRIREFWSPHVIETGTDGAFRCDGVDPGQHPVEAWAIGCGRVIDTVTCVAGTTATITLVIPRGVTVRGTVRNETGDPVAGAVVTTVAPDMVGDPLEYILRGPRPKPEAQSDEVGVFELRGVPAGTLRLLAAKRLAAAKRAAFGQFEGVCQTTMSGRGGDQLTWDPVLVAGKTMRVRIVDADGKPAFVGGTLNAHPEQPAPMSSSLQVFMERMSDRTRPEGLYVFTNCANVPYTLAARLNPGEGERWVYQRGAMPGGPDVVFRLPPRAAVGAPGHVTGRIVDRGNRLATGTLSVTLCAYGTSRPTRLDGDRFTVADVPPGRYFVWAQAGDVPILVGPWFELQTAQRLDLGELETGPAATIRVALRVPPGTRIENPGGVLDESYQYYPLQWDGTHLVAANASVGRHRLTLRAAGWFAPPREVELVAGQEEIVALELVPGTLRKIHVVMPYPDEWQNCDFVLRDAAGTVMAMDQATARGVGLDAHRWHTFLPFELLTLEAVLDGKRHTWPADVRDPEAAAAPLRFSLR